MKKTIVIAGATIALLAFSSVVDAQRGNRAQRGQRGNMQQRGQGQQGGQEQQQRRGGGAMDVPENEQEIGEAGIAWYTTWETGLAEAKRSNRPIFFMSAATACSGVPGVF